MAYNAFPGGRDKSSPYNIFSLSRKELQADPDRQFVNHRLKNRVTCKYIIILDVRFSYYEAHDEKDILAE